MSALTRVTIDPTVRHAIRINSHTAVLEHVHRQPGRRVIEVPGVTGAVASPRHRGHRRPMGRGSCTRGASASRNTRIVPRSRARHRRRPSPRSYPGARRPHRPQRPRGFAFGRTDTTTASAASSKSTPSTTVRVNPRHRCHTLVFRTPSLPPCFEPSDSPKRKKQAGCDRGSPHPATHGSVRRAETVPPRHISRTQAPSVGRAERHEPCRELLTDAAGRAIRYLEGCGFAAGRAQPRRRCAAWPGSAGRSPTGPPIRSTCWRCSTRRAHPATVRRAWAGATSGS